MTHKNRFPRLAHVGLILAVALSFAVPASAEWKEKVLYSFQGNCPAVANNNQNPAVFNVCDITIMGVTNGTSGSGIATIYDQVSNNTKLSDSNLGMYILGEPVQSGSTGTNDTFLGYSHFTTSLNWPTWLVGTSSPSGGCQVGSLYSVTSGSGKTLWECEPTGWQPVD